MARLFTLFIAIATLGLSAAASAPATRPSSAPGEEARATVIEGIDVAALMAGMSVEQKVGQLLFVDFGGKKMSPKLERLIAGKRVGGVALFSHNIKDRRQVRTLVSGIKALDTGGIPPFISVDQEGGNVIRIKDPEAVLPSAMALGATRSVELASTAGRVVGRDLRRLGLNMNLAPVLDVNSNPKNPVIGIRSFGEQPELVAEVGLSFIDGLSQAGIIAVAKHFPGHGATVADSHYGLPTLPHDLERLRRVEFLPFARSIHGGLEAVMTAHIALPKVAEAPDLPATLSRRILTGALREELGFDGIIITDGLEMRGIVERYGLGPAAVLAVQAGADMVLLVWTAERKEEVRQALLRAVADGSISVARLDTSVRRILTAKARHHLFPGQTPISIEVSAAERQINSLIARRAATLVSNSGELVPLSTAGHDRVVVAGHQRVFQRMLRERLVDIEVVEVELQWAPSRERRLRDTHLLLKAAADADAVVVAMTNTYYQSAVRKLKRRYPNKPVLVVSFGSPYMLSRFPEVDAYLCLYSNHESAQVAAAETLLGINPPQGKLPVSLRGLYPYGHGLDYPGSSAASGSTTHLGGVRSSAAVVAPVGWVAP